MSYYSELMDDLEDLVNEAQVKSEVVLRPANKNVSPEFKAYMLGVDGMTRNILSILEQYPRGGDDD